MSGSIAALAQQIQDRALRLNSEQAVLELLQAEQDDVQAELNETQQEGRVVRTACLSATRARHGVELELWKIEARKHECLEALDRLHRDTEVLVESKQRVQEQWESTVEEMLAPHQLHQQIYRHSVKASMNQREGLLEKRDQQLKSLAQRTQQLGRDEKSIQATQKKLEREMAGFPTKEREQDNELSDLARKVKEAIAKVGLEKRHGWLLCGTLLKQFFVCSAPL